MHTVKSTPKNVTERFFEMGITDPKATPELESVLRRFLMGGLLIVRDEDDGDLSIFCLPVP